MRPGFILFAAQIIFGLLLAPYANGRDQINDLSDPELFWQELIVGNITKIVSRDGSQIIFEYDSGGKSVKGRIDQKLLENQNVKTEGSKKAIDVLITRLETNQNSKDQTIYIETVKRLTNLTGQSFEKPSEWKVWYEGSKESLVWSDEKNRLVLESGTN